MGIGEHVGGAVGGNGPTWRGFRPKATGRLENLVLSDVYRLHGMGAATNNRGKLSGKPGEALTDPFSGPGLGYSSRILETMKGLAAGDRTASRQRLADEYARSPYGLKSREYLSASAANERGNEEEDIRQAERVAMANEGQKREDLDSRMRATASSFGRSAGLKNTYASGRYQSDLNRFNRRVEKAKETGAAVSSLVQAVMGGMG